MADKTSLENQVNNLEKAMGTMVKAFKDLKGIVKELEDKLDQAQKGKENEKLKTRRC